MDYIGFMVKSAMNNISLIVNQIVRIIDLCQLILEIINMFLKGMLIVTLVMPVVWLSVPYVVPGMSAIIYAFSGRDGNDMLTYYSNLNDNVLRLCGVVIHHPLDVGLIEHADAA